MNEELNHEREQDTGTEVIPVNTLGAIIQAEIDTAIRTAKAYPRSLARFKKEALAMATLDEETASSCFYSVPRAGKSVEGPSVRLAEIVASAWGNLRFGARVISDNGRLITAQGVCADLERNNIGTIEVQRRVTDKKGRRFSDDMVVVTGNAACSIALRNAVFRVIPRVYVNDILEQARKVAIGDAKTLENRRAEMVAYFGKMGIVPERVFAAVGKSAVEDIGLGELGTLKGFATAIKDGEASVDETFPPLPKPGAEAEAKPASRTDALAAKLGAKDGKPAPEAQEAAR